jgi:ATP citrate (pro-S)-lyase
MSAKAIREAKGKQLLGKHLSSVIVPVQLATYNATVSWDSLISANPWLLNQKLVVKPDQLIKRRGKLGLIKVNVDLNEAKKWISEKMDQEIMVMFCFLF